MSEKLFSYGTLQLDKVQLETFGRLLNTKPDILQGYEIRDCLILDPEVIAASGKEYHPIACFTGNFKSEIAGSILEITPRELKQSDDYEVDDYKRIRCLLKSGEFAWVYVQSGLLIDESKLKQGDLRLEVFKDKHISELTKKACDARIWSTHRNGFENAEIFKTFAIEKAQKAIASKTRNMFVIYYQNEVIGSTSYYNVDLKQLSLTIGYTWLHPDYWGTGINTTIKKLMLNFAFMDLKFNRVSFCIDSENTSSRAVMNKLGIPLEGILKKHQIRPDGSNRDSACYAITNELWLDKFKYSS